MHSVDHPSKHSRLHNSRCITPDVVQANKVHGLMSSAIGAISQGKTAMIGIVLLVMLMHQHID
jgi:hypothetical protein